MASTLTICGHTFHTRLLSADAVVVDCGANEGLFSCEMIDRFGCTSYAFEPSPVVFPAIPERAGLTKVNVALCGFDKNVNLNICESSQSTSLDRLPGQVYRETITVSGRRLEPLLGELGVKQVDLLKVDVEGAEIELFDSCSDAFLRGIGQITIEFHEFLSSSPMTAVQRVLARLRSLGFRELRGTRSTTYHDVLMVNGARQSYMEYLGCRMSLTARHALHRLRQKFGQRGASRPNQGTVNGV